MTLILTVLLLALSPVTENEQVVEVVQVTTFGIEEERTASVSLGDVDQDGDLDAVFANGRHWAGQNRIFLNNGKGRPTVGRLLGSDQATTYAVPLGDLDGDGDLDVAVGNDKAPNRIFWNDGAGRFTEGPVFGGIDNTRGVFLGDLDQDGRLDIVLTNRGEPNAIYFGAPASERPFTRSVEFGTADDSTISVAIADLNGDRYPELVLANRDGQANRVVLNEANADGTRRFVLGSSFGTGSDETRSVAVADLNGDSHLDVVAVNIGQPNSLFFGSGTGVFTAGQPFGAFGEEGGRRSYSVAVGDLNGDGRLDVVVGNSRQSNVVYLNLEDSALASGFRMEAVTFGQDHAATYGVALGDFNGDGTLEIVTANSDAQNGLFAVRTQRPKSSP